MVTRPLLGDLSPLASGHSEGRILCTENAVIQTILTSQFRFCSISWKHDAFSSFMFIISGIVCFNSLINESILVGNVHQFIVNVPWMQRSGLGSELDIDCLIATLCLGTMISWLHYVRCVVRLQMKIITSLAKLSGNKSCPPRLLTNSAGCRHCEASLKPISLTFRMFLFFSDFYDRRHNWFHNTIDKSQVTKPRQLQHSRLGPCLRVHIMLMKWYPGKAGDLVHNGWAVKLNHLHP